jgi:CDP-4-dehydro-6-deoxyglucose reductase
MSTYWFSQAKENDLLQITGPLGSFYVRDAIASSTIFLATGTGIGPIKAILEELSEAARRPAMGGLYLFWGGRISEDLFWQPDYINIDLKYIPVLSRGKNEWSGARGHVQDAIGALGIDLTTSVVYACGSPAMITSSRDKLVAHGLAPTNFHSDAFVASSS